MRVAMTELHKGEREFALFVACRYHVLPFTRSVEFLGASIAAGIHEEGWTLREPKLKRRHEHTGPGPRPMAMRPRDDN